MLLRRRNYLVRQRVAVLALADTYDILDPESGQTIGLAREELGEGARLGRLFLKKAYLPSTVRVHESETAPPVLTLRSRPGLLGHAVVVTDATGREIGRFQRKAFSLGVSFLVLGRSGERIAEVKGDWKGWNFRFLGAGGGELGRVTKKWAGIGREILASAGTYVISLTEQGTGNPDHAPLLLAAALAIDLVFRERQ